MAAIGPSTLRRARQILLIALLLLALGAVYFFVFTATGHRLRSDPRALGADFHQIVARHPVLAPLLMIGLYILLTALMAPVWWVQVLAGYAFGLTLGTLYCIIAATLGAIAAFGLSRFLAADFFHEKIESHLARLRRIDQTLGNNGLLVVMAVRLVHVLPFGLSNYLFGLTQMRRIDVIVGTALGVIPSLLIPVAAGTDPRLLKLSNGRFWLPLLGLNVLLLIPPLLWYWFQRRRRRAEAQVGGVPSMEQGKR
jgi:uncharacterized membrane protein YdjX (TVP38/TMEM64 family)